LSAASTFPTAIQLPVTSSTTNSLGLERFTKYSESLIAAKTPTLLASDYNVIPTDLDVYKPERWVDDALFRPEVREAFTRLIALG
jgi:exodeoxyribonuclease-3